VLVGRELRHERTGTSGEWVAVSIGLLGRIKGGVNLTVHP